MAFKTFNLAEVYGAADRANAQRDAQQYQQYQIQRQMRDDQRSDAVRGAYKIGQDGNIDRQGTLAALYGIDPMTAIQTQSQWQKQDAEAAETASKKKKNDLDYKVAQASFSRDQLAGVRDQNGYNAWRQDAISMGAPAEAIPEQYDPAWQQSNLLKAEDFIKQNTPKYERVDLGGKVEIIDVNPFTNPKIKGTSLDKTATIGERETARHNQVAEGISNAQLGISRGNSAETARHNRVTETNSKSGNAKITEGERKAATLLQRLQFSQQQLDNAVAESPAAQSPSLTASGLRGIGAESLANAITPANRQRVEAAQLDILDAALTLGTGAAYTREQLEGYRKSYFPQIGDDQATINDKKARLDNVIESAKVAAGNAAPQVERQQIIPKNEPMPTSKPPPKVGEVVNGYVFKGGDPSNEKSWKKK